MRENLSMNRRMTSQVLKHEHSRVMLVKGFLVDRACRICCHFQMLQKRNVTEAAGSFTKNRRLYNINILFDA